MGQRGAKRHKHELQGVGCGFHEEPFGGAPGGQIKQGMAPPNNRIALREPDTALPHDLGSARQLHRSALVPADEIPEHAE